MLKCKQLAAPCWRLLLVIVAVSSLGVHLADRVRAPVDPGVAVHAAAPKVQHMDQDTWLWLVEPAACLFRPQFSIFNPRVKPYERGYLQPRVDCLYNRPPPNSV